VAFSTSTTVTSTTLAQQLRREWHLLMTDNWLRASVSWVPLLLFFILWWIFSSGIPQNLSIGIVDLDHSDLSRSLVRHYDSNPVLSVMSQYANVKQGSQALISGKINALVIIPFDLKRDVMIGHPPQVTAFYNTQFLLTGKLVSSGLEVAQLTFSAKIDIVKAMIQGDALDQAIASAVPISTQITPLFNANNNYAQFLASAVIPAIWQVLIVLITMLALSRELRLNGLVDWLKDNPFKAIMGKLLPYTFMLWLHGAIFLYFMFEVLHWPMHGDWMILLISQLLMILASQAVALLAFVIVQNADISLSFAAAYTAPSFAFMGITFPASNMNLLAQIWRDLIPVSHYMQIQLYQSNHGASIQTALPEMGALVLFLITFFIAWQWIHYVILKSYKMPIANVGVSKKVKLGLG
jgi:ABC-2 type transport system permease protein